MQKRKPRRTTESAWCCTDAPAARDWFERSLAIAAQDQLLEEKARTLNAYAYLDGPTDARSRMVAEALELTARFSCGPSSTIHYAPSIAVLQYTSGKRRSGGAPRYLLVGDPADLPRAEGGKPLPRLPVRSRRSRPWLEHSAAAT